MLLHLNKLESPSPKDGLRQSLCWNWPSGSGEDDFYISLMYFRYFIINSLWKRAGPIIRTNLNPLFSKIHGAKFGWNGRVVLEKRIFNFVNVFLPVEKGRAHLWINLNPHQIRMLCVKFGWNWPSGSGEEDKNMKRLRRRQRTTNKFWSEKLTWVFHSGELINFSCGQHTCTCNMYFNLTTKAYQYGICEGAWKQSPD